MLSICLATVLVILLLCALLLLAPKWEKPRLLENIVNARGYRLQEHKVLTRDGYYLMLHRIVSADYTPDDDAQYCSSRKPVLIAHGLFCSSIDFLYTCSSINGAKGSESMVSYLLENGRYDVWLMNNRGNCFSGDHQQYSRADSQFWRFSINELVEYDLTCAIDSVRTKTAREEIAFIGFSQGNLLMFALLAEHPEYARMCRPIIAWAPAVFFSNMQSPIRNLPTAFVDCLHWLAGQYPLFRFTNLLGRTFRPTPIVQWVTAILFRSTMGQTNYWSHTKLPIWLHLFPSSGSTWQFVHHLQWIRSGRFSKFDFGTSKSNIAQYGQASPPEYQLERIPPETMLILMRGSTDTMTSDADTDHLVKLLRPRIKTLIDYTVSEKIFNHLDFIMNVKAGKVVYEKTMQLLDAYC